MSSDGYCPSAEDMLFSIICTTVNWEVAALSYRKQDEDKLEETKLEETKTQMHPQKSEMVCHGEWPHAAETRSEVCLTTGEKKGGKTKTNKPNNKTKQNTKPRSQEEIQ